MASDLSAVAKVGFAFLFFAQHKDPVNGDFDQLLSNCYHEISELARKNPTVFGIPDTEEAIEEFLCDKLRNCQKVKVHFSEVNAMMVHHGLIGQREIPFAPPLNLTNFIEEIRSSPPDTHQDLNIEGTNAPIDASNNKLAEEFVEAMKDATNTHDSRDNGPYQKWQEMPEAEYHRLSCWIVNYIDNMYKGKNSILGLGEELSCQERIESVKQLLRKCKGSVYKMTELHFVEKCVRYPRMGERIFSDNQEGNKKRKESVKLQREFIEGGRVGSGSGSRS
ncbi:hypothetical protein L873DRAFT_1788548 [Choiromyces venosus 120613-1]|uniref:Uncharacterized protein n=1 Tax=Choiromyces venosus 120613-1 TaxID=1336337 RepID=A0A3N4JUP3_9PEZI|nr:hypothetical protein L873DRAFT_1788548 [Choiromyces venosus 120613-1]